MRFGEIAVDDAQGAILAHSVKHAGGVFKKAEITPILGCLPMFLQMPIWVRRAEQRAVARLVQEMSPKILETESFGEIGHQRPSGGEESIGTACAP